MLVIRAKRPQEITRLSAYELLFRKLDDKTKAFFRAYSINLLLSNEFTWL